MNNIALALHPGWLSRLLGSVMSKKKSSTSENVKQFFFPKMGQRLMDSVSKQSSKFRKSISHNSERKQTVRFAKLREAEKDVLSTPCLKHFQTFQGKTGDVNLNDRQ